MSVFGHTTPAMVGHVAPAAIHAQSGDDIGIGVGRTIVIYCRSSRSFKRQAATCLALGKARVEEMNKENELSTVDRATGKPKNKK